jgi:hypothetical protein
LTSLDEILDSGIEFGYDEYSNIGFSLSSDLRHKEVVEGAEMCSNISECINDHSSICLLNEDDYIFFFVTT